METGPPSGPRWQGRVPAGGQFRADLGIQLVQDGAEQPGLVAEMMVQRPPRHPRLGRHRVQRYLGKALVGKGRARHCDQPIGGVLRGFGAGLALS